MTHITEELTSLANYTELEKLQLQKYYYLQLTQSLDLKAKAMHSQGQLSTFPSSKGQEAIFVGTGLAIDKKDIYLPYYRDHGCLIQRNVKIEEILLYWGGFESGNTCGFTQDFPICIPISSQTTHAAGAAWKIKKEDSKQIVICSLGDGATSKGDFYESINFASIHNLPILYNINANKLAISTPFSKQSKLPLEKKLQGFGIKIISCNSLDIDEVVNKVKQAREYIIQTKNPCIIIHNCYRLDPHTVIDDYCQYEEKKIIQTNILKYDPVKIYKEKITSKSPRLEKHTQIIINEAQKKINASFEIFKKEKEKQLKDKNIKKHNILPTTAISLNPKYFKNEKKEITMANAINLALDEQMELNKNIVLLGQDIGKCEGVFRVTKGLLKKYGPLRVIDMPLSEALIAGASVGMAYSELKPIAEFQFMGFSYTGLDQIINHASRIKTRMRSTKTAAIVYRIPCGVQINAPEHHAESTEALFCHIPGLRVVYPSNPKAAYDLMRESIHSQDPVVFLEPIGLYQKKGSIHISNTEYNLNKAVIEKEGSDITIISWGLMLERVRQIVKKIGNSINIELIDLVNLKPIDYKTLLQSVEKTGRCIIIQESNITCSLASEISATISDKKIEYLRCPVKRVSPEDIVMPYYQKIDSYIPQDNEIIEICRNLMTY